MRILWMQQRVERQLLVGAVSSFENVTDIGTKRLSVPTMKYPMHKLGVYDSESSKLVGCEGTSNKHVKQTLKQISKFSSGQNGVKLVQLLLAHSLSSVDALSLPSDFGAMMEIGDVMSYVMSYMLQCGLAAFSLWSSSFAVSAD